jgi:hypothetical protein
VVNWLNKLIKLGKYPAIKLNQPFNVINIIN